MSSSLDGRAPKKRISMLCRLAFFWLDMSGGVGGVEGGDAEGGGGGRGSDDGAGSDCFLPTLLDTFVVCQSSFNCTEKKISIGSSVFFLPRCHRWA